MILISGKHHTNFVYMRTSGNTKNPFIIFMLLLLTLFITISFYKKGTFVDEQLTYDLSNRQAPQISFMMNYLKDSKPQTVLNDLSDILENGKSNSQIYRSYQTQKALNADNSLWHDSQYFSDYIQVEDGSRFDFLSVFYNSIYDSAPPFYYYIIHFVCSLFPNSFSLWYGLAVNILFLMLTCGLLYKLTQKYMAASSYAMLITLCYALSIGGISTLTIIRMYAVYTFFILAFFAINLNILENNFIFTRKTYIYYILIAVLGFYTQYYFIIYASLLIATILLFLLCKREYRKCFNYIKFSVLALVISFIIWPFSIKHIFLDSFGASTLTNAVSTNIFFKIKEYLAILTKSLFANNIIIFTFFCLLLVIGFAFYIYKTIHEKQNPLNHISSPLFLRSVILLFPVAGYFVMVAISSPFYSDRYIMCIFPFVILGLYCLLKQLVSLISFRFVFPVLCFIGILITLLGLTTSECSYFFKNQTEKYELVKNADETICIYVTTDEDGWQYKSCLDLISACKKTALLYPSQITELHRQFPQSGEYEQVLICITSSYEQQSSLLNSIIAECGLQAMTINPLPAENDGYATMYLLCK